MSDFHNAQPQVHPNTKFIAELRAKNLSKQQLDLLETIARWPVEKQGTALQAAFEHSGLNN